MGGGGPKMPTLPPQTTLGTASNPLSTWRAPGPPAGMLQAIMALAGGSMLRPEQYMGIIGNPGASQEILGRPPLPQGYLDATTRAPVPATKRSAGGLLGGSGDR